MTQDKAIIKPDNRNLELQELIDFSKVLLFPTQGSDGFNRKCAFNCLRKYGLIPCKKLVAAVRENRGKQYAPVINDFNQLYKKAGDLICYVERHSPRRTHVAL
jgi:hypothetical protein